MSGLVEALELLRAAWPQQPFGDVAVRVYAAQLADLPESDVYGAVDRLAKTSVRAPSIAEIRREAIEARLALPSADEAWDLALRGDLSNAVVRAAAKAVGGTWMIRHGENSTALHAQFRKTYDARRERRIRDAATGKPLDAYTLIEARRGQPALPPAGVESINGRRYLAIPETTRVRPRPVTARMALRYAGRIVPPPGHEEVSDAIRLLEAGPTTDDPRDDPLYREAEAVMRDATADPVRLRDTTKSGTKRKGRKR